MNYFGSAHQVGTLNRKIGPSNGRVGYASMFEARVCYRETSRHLNCFAAFPTAETPTYDDHYDPVVVGWTSLDMDMSHRSKIVAANAPAN